jgi:hypothetical protein
MPTQRESIIEDFAFDYIQSHYATNAGVKSILVDKAERTKLGHVVDGLFTFKSPENNLFVATLHTKTSPKIASLLIRYKTKGLSKFRFATAALLFTAAFLFGWQVGKWPVLYVLPTSLFIAAAGFVLHSVLERNYLKKKLENLLNDLKKLPADEQWLGISVSSLTFRQNSMAKHLLDICKRRGIGVITVGKRAKVVLVQEPTTQTCRRGDFLSFYEGEARIRKALLGDSYLRVA